MFIIKKFKENGNLSLKDMKYLKDNISYFENESKDCVHMRFLFDRFCKNKYYLTLHIDSEYIRSNLF